MPATIGWAREFPPSPRLFLRSQKCYPDAIHRERIFLPHTPTDARDNFTRFFRILQGVNKILP